MEDNDNDEYTRLRNGVNRNTQQHQTPNDAETYAQYLTRRSGAVNHERGLHETMDFYDDCTKRQRNTSECGREGGEGGRRWGGGGGEGG